MTEAPAARRLPHVSAADQQRLQALFRRLRRTLGPELTGRLAFALYRWPKPRRLEDRDAPCLASARVRWVPSPRGRLRLLEWGEGPLTLLLQHGWGSHAPRWSAFVAGALQRGWRVLALEAPGHGGSAGLFSDLPAFEAGLQALQRVEPRIDGLVAHSLGALACVRWLVQRPAATQGPHAAVLVSLPQDLEHLLCSFEQLLDLDEATRSALRRRFAARYGSEPSGAACRADLADLVLPVMLVHDRDDDVVPSVQSEALAAVLPPGRLRLTEGLGHSGPLRDPATIQAALEFIAAAVPRLPSPR